MLTFNSSAWDKLVGPPDNGVIPGCAPGLTLAQYQRVVARDLETLLNTRSAIPETALAAFPACRSSIVNFGLADFAHLCLTSSADRKTICDLLRLTIERHEPRLRNVRASLLREPGVINRLSFTISAHLLAPDNGERVQFNVLLEPSNLHYSIR